VPESTANSQCNLDVILDGYHRRTAIPSVKGPPMTDLLAQFKHLRGRRVMIVTPIYREAAAEYTQSLIGTIAACVALGIYNEITQVVGDSMLPRARNQLVARFLASGAQDALFIDADMEWQASDVLHLLSSDQLMIGGACRRRLEMPESDPRSWCMRFKPDSRGRIREDRQGAFEVEGAGLGFLRVNRQVFERLIAAHPAWKAPGSAFMTPQEREHYYRFFRFPEEEDLGEDIFFCRAWQEIGGTAWIDPRLSIGHVGSKVYRGNVHALLRRGPLPAAAPAQENSATVGS
jgi:hypothetical protein